MISAELRETLIIATVQALDAAHPQALSSRLLLIPLKQSGLGDLTEKDVLSLVADLEEKGWLKASDSEAAPELRRYKRTEEARSYLRRNGF